MGADVVLSIGYVGYDTDQDTDIVAHQRTDPTKM